MLWDNLQILASTLVSDTDKRFNLMYMFWRGVVLNVSHSNPLGEVHLSSGGLEHVHDLTPWSLCGVMLSFHMGVFVFFSFSTPTRSKHAARWEIVKLWLIRVIFSVVTMLIFIKNGEDGVWGKLRLFYLSRIARSYCRWERGQTWSHWASLHEKTLKNEAQTFRICEALPLVLSVQGSAPGRL